MHHVKTFAVGAVLFAVSSKLASMDFVSKASPTVAQYAPYLISGGGLLLAKKFNLV